MALYWGNSTYFQCRIPCFWMSQSKIFFSIQIHDVFYCALFRHSDICGVRQSEATPEQMESLSLWMNHSLFIRSLAQNYCFVPLLAIKTNALPFASSLNFTWLEAPALRRWKRRGAFSDPLKRTNVSTYSKYANGTAFSWMHVVICIHQLMMWSIKRYSC